MVVLGGYTAAIAVFLWATEQPPFFHDTTKRPQREHKP